MEHQEVAKRKAVISDFIGTLVNAPYYDLEASRRILHRFLNDSGLETNWTEFLKAYVHAHEKYRVVRYEQMREVTNAVWVCEALENLGFVLNSDDSRIKVALEAFFKKYLDSLVLRPFARRLVQRIRQSCKLSMVSNFTYAPLIYTSLRKLNIDRYFNTVVVSHECGWRKSHKQIFQEILRKLDVNAEEAVLIGDSPLEDIKGAQAAGIKTVFVSSQFY
jgi:FMN phosphatase YigB (HAD superfamily)